ncbi:PIG-L family deacetylase [Streptomyces sp. NPDC047976]|uniref:PIG-L family deacetylase n=1 Tax=Streptomyces sp. NPDC047976 TaxID=3155746 RepID=UPI0034271E27
MSDGPHGSAATPPSTRKPEPPSTPAARIPEQRGTGPLAGSPGTNTAAAPEPAGPLAGSPGDDARTAEAPEPAGPLPTADAAHPSPEAPAPAATPADGPTEPQTGETPADAAHHAGDMGSPEGDAGDADATEPAEPRAAAEAPLPAPAATPAGGPAGPRADETPADAARRAEDAGGPGDAPAPRITAHAAAPEAAGNRPDDAPGADAPETRTPSPVRGARGEADAAPDAPAPADSPAAAARAAGAAGDPGEPGPGPEAGPAAPASAPRVPAPRAAGPAATPGPAGSRPDAAPGPGPGTGTGAGAARNTHGAAARHPVARKLVKAVGLVAATAAGGMLVIRGNEALAAYDAPTAADSRATTATAVDAPDPGRVLQIVAHPDDDLYFMNPDLRYSIAAGHPVTSVYLTSGEADGINAGAAKQASTRPDKPAYAEARQNGIRAAYAKMATGDRSSAWKRTVIPTKGGGQAEVDVLVAKPEINLVWLQLREAGNVYADVPDSLHGLWDGRVPHLESVLASGSPVRHGFTYTKDQVVQTIKGILEHYRPTTIRAQDPTPGRFQDTKRYTDHQDHFYGARFAQMATAAYAQEVKDRPHFAVQNYIGYFNGSLPSALDPGEAKEKLDILDTYAWLDKENHCGSEAGCGDLKVADHPSGNRWTQSINYARGTSTSWLASDAEHGLWAFKVLDGQVAVWHRTGLIGNWTGPRLLPGTGMDQGISTVTLKDGRIAAFGTRTSFGDKPAGYLREVVYAVQQAPGSAEFGPWQSLGTPEGADDTWTSDISAPAVSVDGTGALAVYVRDGASTLRGRVQRPDGEWGPWDSLGGSDLHGTPATATDGAGRRMVFAATTKTVTAWAQPEPGAPLGPATPTGLPDTTLPLTAQGRERGVRLLFRKPGSGNVRSALVTATADGGLKADALTDLGGLQGYGPVTASGHVLAGRSAGGQLGSDVGPGGAWQRSPLMFVGAPSSTMTGKNLVSLAVVGLDARLYVTSSTDDSDAYLAPWQPVGPRNTAP